MRNILESEIEKEQYFARLLGLKSGFKIADLLSGLLLG